MTKTIHILDSYLIKKNKNNDCKYLGCIQILLKNHLTYDKSD